MMRVVEVHLAKNQSSHEHIKRVKALAKEVGGELTTTRGNHLCIQVGARKFFASLTPSDNRATLNFVKFVRRELRKDA